MNQTRELGFAIIHHVSPMVLSEILNKRDRKEGRKVGPLAQL